MGSSADLNLASCFGVVASVAGYIFELDERCIGDIPRPFFCTVEAKTSVELEDKIPFIRELADLYGDSFPSEGPVVDREGTISPALTSARDMILQVWAQVWSGRPPLGILCDENVFYCFQMDGQDTLYMQGPMAICALPGALSLSPHQQLTPERFVTALATAYFRALQSPPQPGIPNAPSNNPTPHGGPQGDPTHSQCLWTMRCLAHCESLVVHMPYGQTVELSRIARPVSVPFPVSMPLPATGVSDLALPRVMRVEVLGVAGSGVDAVAFRGRADSVPVVLKLGVRRRRREEAPPGVGYEWSRLERILPADAGEAGRLPIPSYFGLFRGMDSVEMILMSDGGVPLNSDKALSDAMQPEVERAYEMLRGVGIEPTDNNSCNVVFDGHQIRVIDFADEFHL